MRTSPIVLVLSLLCAPAVHASDEGVESTVADIRALYGEVGGPQNDDDACFGEPCRVAETSFMRMMPGSGPQQTHVRFLYAEHLPDEELIYGEPYLRKAVVRYNVAAQEYTVEYLFAGVQPKLVFHFQSDPRAERRTWIDGGEAIRIDHRPVGEPAKKTVRDGDFTAAELQHVAATHTRAAEVLTLFGTLVGVADGEMAGWLYEDE